MPAREFFGESLKACLEQVKSTLGSDAIIIETKKVRQGGGLLGVQGREIICVVATTEAEYHAHEEPEETDKDILAIRETLVRLRATAAQTNQAPATPSPTSQTPAVPNQASALAAARSAYKTQSAPTTRLDAVRPTTSKPLYRKATFPVVERNAPDTEVQPPAPEPPTLNITRLLPPATYTTPNPFAQEEARASVPSEPKPTPPTIRNFSPLTRSANTAKPSAPAPTHSPENRFGGTTTATLKATPSNAVLEPDTAVVAVQEPTNKVGRNLQEIKQSLQQLRSRFSDYEKNLTAVTSQGSARHALSHLSVTSGQYPELRKRLCSQGVSPHLTEDLIRQIPDLSAWGELAQEVQAEIAARELITKRIACVGSIALTPSRLKTVALVGPTGVGKTTTIAKLAAHYALVEQKKVALLTIDTYRIAAVEQLKTYSQIMDIPIFVAHEAGEIVGILEQCRDYDLLLVDTAGRSPNNTTQIMELKPMLETLGCETHLVLSASTKEEDLYETAKRFSMTRIDRLIFSKIDETSTYGTLFNISDRTGIPLTYLTNGQRVPEDILVATGEAVSNLILS